MQVINSVLQPPDFPVTLCLRHTWDFPELNSGFGCAQKLEISPGAADHVLRDEGCWLQLSRLKMLSKKNFCAAQGRDFQS